MIYRIDFQHFMSHAIDHFTSEELSHFQYAIISAKVRNGHRATNVSKVSELYPTPEIVTAYAEYGDKKILEKMYTELLDPPKESKETWAQNKIYNTFVNTLLNHYDVVIVCDKDENVYIDVLCKVLKKRYEIDVIDLNQLFTKGYVGSIYIDRDAIWDRAVDIRRQAAKEMTQSLESSSDGRMKLLGLMNKKQKIEKLKDLGISVTTADKDNLDKLLIEEWVNEDGD